jgi:hypothetical protein
MLVVACTEGRSAEAFTPSTEPTRSVSGMIRSAASKVMWVGRATVFLVGLAVILALLFGVASTALGANGKPLILGKAANTASKITGLVKSGAGPALRLKVDSGPPMAVNSSEKVPNFNADQLDGEDQSAFADVSELDAATVISRWSELPTEGTYTSEGGTLLVSAAGSGFRSDSNTRTVGDIGMRILVDGTVRGEALLHANERQSHKPFVARQVVVKGLAAGSHTIRLEAIYGSNCNTDSETRFSVCTTTNSNDRFEVTVLEFSD